MSTEVNRGDNTSSNYEGSNGLNAIANTTDTINSTINTDTNTRNDTSNSNGDAAAPGGSSTSPMERPGSCGDSSRSVSARGKGEKGTGATRTAAKVKPLPRVRKRQHHATFRRCRVRRVHAVPLNLATVRHAYNKRIADLDEVRVFVYKYAGGSCSFRCL